LLSAQQRIRHGLYAASGFRHPTTLVIVSGRTHGVGNFDRGLKLGGGVHPARIGPRARNELSDHGLGETTGFSDVDDREMRIPRLLCQGRAATVYDAQNGSLASAILPGYGASASEGHTSCRALRARVSSFWAILTQQQGEQKYRVRHVLGALHPLPQVTSMQSTRQHDAGGRGVWFPPL
jgi:hypothetical protein